MSKLNPTEKFVVMEKLIRQKRTGTAKQLARRLSVSRATVFRMIDEFNTRGAMVEFCSLCKSYIYGGNKVVNIQFNIGIMPEMTEEDMKNTSGGHKIFSCFLSQPLKFNSTTFDFPHLSISAFA